MPQRQHKAQHVRQCFFFGPDSWLDLLNKKYRRKSQLRANIDSAERHAVLSSAAGSIKLHDEL